MRLNAGITAVLVMPGLMVVILLLKKVANSSHLEVEAHLRMSGAGVGFYSLSVVENSVLDLFLFSVILKK